MTRILSLDPEGTGLGEPPGVAGEREGSGARGRPRSPCVNHPRVPSTHTCLGCVSAICATCAFTFPGGRDFCPACATASRDHLTGSRRTAVVWSLVLAAFASLAVLGFLIGAVLLAPLDKQGETMLGTSVALLGMLPAIAGLALSIGAWEKRAANPTILWVGVIWNAALAGVVLLLSVLGTILNLTS